MDKLEDKQGLKVETGAATVESVTDGNSKPISANKRGENLRKYAFKPGQSGNPSGRPKMEPHAREIARGYSVEAIHRLAQIMRGDDVRAACNAASTILDRGLGRPVQSVELSRKSLLDELAPEELMHLRAALLVQDVRVIEHDPTPALPDPDPALDQPDQS